jgi:hypothetical protein
VWHEHLRPLLSVREVTRLRIVCKSLKLLGRGWPMRLGWVRGEDLEAALTCFPAAEGFTMYYDEPLDPAEESRVVELLRAHGGTLKRVEAFNEVGERLLLSAVRAGALPNLTSIYLSLDSPDSREVLSGGILRFLEDVEVRIDDGEQVAVLEPLRLLPHLRCLSLECPDGVAAFPPFIPPSLKALIIEIKPSATPGSLPRELPSMLQASGACLELFEVRSPYVELTAQCGVAVARVLHRCSSTLKTVKLLHLAGGRELVPGLIRCCATLEVLHCRWDVFSALPATCPTFPRLTELHLEVHHGAVDLASRAWGVMAEGRLPALATLTVKDFRRLPGGEGWVGGRLARALEAVGATLRRLTLIACGHGKDTPAGAAYELGAAMGKLRRLRYLHLDLLCDGQDYYAWGGAWLPRGAAPSLARFAWCTSRGTSIGSPTSPA